MTLAELARVEGWKLETIPGLIMGDVFAYVGWDVPTNVYRLTDYVVSSRNGPGIWFREWATHPLNSNRKPNR